jgi:hypothetical protein
LSVAIKAELPELLLARMQILTIKHPSASSIDQQTLTFEEHAQHGHGIKRPAERTSAFLLSLATRSRTLCAFQEISYYRYSKFPKHLPE